MSRLFPSLARMNNNSRDCLHAPTLPNHVYLKHGKPQCKRQFRIQMPSSQLRPVCARQTTTTTAIMWGRHKIIILIFPWQRHDPQHSRIADIIVALDLIESSTSRQHGLTAWHSSAVRQDGVTASCRGRWVGGKHLGKHFSRWLLIDWTTL